VSGFEPPESTRSHDRVIQFALHAAEEAFRQAGVVSADGTVTIDAADVRVAVGTSKGGILTFSQMVDRLREKPADLADQLPHLFDIPPDAPSRCIARRLNARGGMHTTVSACSTATQSVIRGCRYLLDGDADMVICGGADASLHPLWLAAFRQMGVLADVDPELGPAYVCRPFDVHRQGFVVGEGAAVFVLETLASARRRCAEPLARITGFAEGSDPTALTRMDESGRHLAAVVKLALHRAGLRAEDLAAVHAHATGTVSNDLLEYRAYRTLLGGELANVPVASLKGAIGHLLGAAGGVETAMAIQSLRTGVCPAHATLVESDPCFEEMWLPTSPVEIRRGPVLKTSLGFGGHLAVLVLEAV
jgi:3-oxoacyl-[acyl-carrier-protein] synthase II